MRILFLFFLLFSTPLLAQKTSKTYYVFAENGLILRDKPQQDGKKLINIPYGTALNVKDDTRVGTATSVKEIATYSISGKWIAVIFGGQNGYVFDGYLSQLPAPKKNQEEDFETQLTQLFTAIGKHYEVKKADDSDDFITHFKQKYGKGVLLEHTRGEGSSMNTIFIPNVTLREGYLFAKALAYDPQYYSLPVFNKKTSVFNIDTNNEDGVGCSIEVKKEKNGVSINIGCGC